MKRKCDNKNVFIETFSTPCGDIILGAIGESLCLCDWKDGKAKALRSLSKMKGVNVISGRTLPILDEAYDEILEYFSGKRKCFDVKFYPMGTEFQTKVWQTLCQVRYGETISYSELAHSIGRPSSVRAVANAVGANPLSLFIPCHRIIGSDGSLTGYAGGIEIKRFLLMLEGGKS